MSGARNRRFPRTAGAVPEVAPKIEREKIRHPQPKDLLLDAGEPGPSRQVSMAEHADGTIYAVGNDAYVDEADLDWTPQDDASAEASDWDYEPEDDWTLDGDDQSSSTGYEETVVDHGGEESGVVWEDDAYDDHFIEDDPDEVTFGQASEDITLGPEVELAGRRDVRPKPPKPAPAPRARTPKQQTPRQRQRTMAPQPGRQPRTQGGDALAPPPMAGGFARRMEQQRQRPPPVAEADAQPVDNGRFSRTRATLGVTEDASDTEVLQPSRGGPTPRRRQAHPKPATPRSTGRRASRPRRGGARRKGLMKIASVLVLLVGGGWFAYQAMGSEGVQPMIDRVTSLLPLPLPGAGRTADDTSFGNQVGTVSPEQAISDLEQRLRQQQGDAAASAADGPPIPKFKPLPGTTRSLAVGGPADAADESQLAANGGEDDGGEPSIFEQIWRYLSPG